MSFLAMRNAVNAQLAMLTEKSTELFTVDVNTDDLWDLYLASFPEGTNPLYRKRTEHDGSYDKNFIRHIGNVVGIIDGKMVSIWDIELDDFRQVVTDALADRVKSAKISNLFRYWQKRVGVESNYEALEGGQKLWEHFYYDLPNKFINAQSGSFLSETRANKQVLERGIREVTYDAIETVLDLITQGSLYKGDEFKPMVDSMSTMKEDFQAIESDDLTEDLYLWEKSLELGDAKCRIRNSAIGNLLVDLSDGRDLEEAARAYEKTVAPENYKRPTALITQRQIDEANETIVELGYEPTLNRRPAMLEDISVANTLFADRDAQTKMKGNALDLLTPTKANNKRKFDKVEEVSIADFIANVLPKATSLEVMMENRHTPNLVSLVAPVYADAPNMLKWGNNYSWSYNGELADASIAQLVKAAGGNINADVRNSLAWFNGDDLDLSVVEPDGNVIDFGNKRSHRTKGFLDVDMNACGVDSRTPVENIAYAKAADMQEGRYKVVVKNFRLRERVDFGFVLEFEHFGSVMTYEYKDALPNKQSITVLEFDYSHRNGVTIVRSIEGAEVSRNEWGVDTHQWTKVAMVLNSPNHWDGEQVGNKHLFFMLDGCKSPDKIRGFYNEYLSDDLKKHRKVFEALGSKLKADPTDDQLSGLGFSSTQRNDVLVKVSGSFNRVVKVIF